MRLIVDIWLDMATVIGHADVLDFGNAQDLFSARAVELIAPEVASPSRHLVVGPKERSLFKNEHGFALPREAIGNGSAPGTTANNDDLEAVHQDGPFPTSQWLRELSGSTGWCRAVFPAPPASRTEFDCWSWSTCLRGKPSLPRQRCRRIVDARRPL